MCCIYRWAMFQAKVWERTCRVFLHQSRLFSVKAVVLLDCMGQRNLRGQNRIFLHLLTLMKKKKSCLCRSCSSGRKEMYVLYIYFLIIVTKILTLYKISTNYHLSVFNSIVLIWSLFLWVVFTFIWTILCAHFSLVVENLVNRNVLDIHPEPWWFSRTNFCGIASKDPGCCSGILALTTSLSVICLDTQTMSCHTVWVTPLTAFSYWTFLSSPCSSDLWLPRKFCDVGREEEAEICVQNSRGADCNWANETTAAWSYQWTCEG